MTGSSLLSAIAFAGVGLVVWTSVLAVILRVLPGNLWHQATVDRNVGAAVLIGAWMIGSATIIAAAVH